MLSLVLATVLSSQPGFEWTIEHKVDLKMVQKFSTRTKANETIQISKGSGFHCRIQPYDATKSGDTFLQLLSLECIPPNSVGQLSSFEVRAMCIAGQETPPVMLSLWVRHYKDQKNLMDYSVNTHRIIVTCDSASFDL